MQGSFLLCTPAATYDLRKGLLIAAELPEGARLNDSTVKQLCSTDDIFAEKKYKDPFSFTPSHTPGAVHQPSAQGQRRR